MDTFVDSSWYYIRYTDPNNKKKFADSKKMEAWLPVSMYIGGAEHNTMHLLYSRFFTKALHDLKLVPFNEPFTGRRNHGIILGPDGQKMSKSRGNVVDPDKEVAQYGADTVRMYLAFMAPYEQGGPWDPKGINGAARFLRRMWELGQREFGESAHECTRAIHRAVKKIGEDLEELKLNTAVSELMKVLNVAEAGIAKEDFEMLLKILAPLAPHITEELWHQCGHTTSIHLESWPTYDPKLLVEEVVEIPVQVNGKVRGTIAVPPDIKEDDAVFAARQAENIAKYLEGVTVQKIIYIPGRLLNLVVS
jgi:leucyl-tRNA synthetase